jgi:adenine phosphoribosyltransferase
MTDVALEQAIRCVIRDVPDFPKPGIVFKDITPLLSDAALFARVTDAMAVAGEGSGVTHVAGIESRGFIFGVPVAQRLGVAFVPIRKPGKLPYQTVRESYALEYGTDMLEVHVDGFGAGARVVIVDDVLATGGTAAAACRLIERTGASVAALSFLMELTFLPGREALTGRRVESLISY